MLEVQKYLKTHTLKDLKDEYLIHANQSIKNPKKWCFTYDKHKSPTCSSSPLNERIVEECRGLVLELEFDQNGFAANSSVLALPFFRFYNYGQAKAAPINWDKAEFQIKEDGTLCTVYYDCILKEWCVSTRSTADADVSMETGKTFRELFELAAYETYLLPFKQWTEKFLDRACCYVFELTSPENTIVVKYDLYRIRLLTIRNMFSLKELPMPDGKIWLNVKRIPFKGLNEAIKALESLSALENEGYVVFDGENRVKVKHSNYNALHSAKDEAVNSPRSMLRTILANKYDDVVPLLSEHQAKELNEIKTSYKILCDKNDSDWKRLKHIESRKELAQAINREQLDMPYLMNRFTKKVSSYEEYAALHIKNGVWSNGFLDTLLFQLKDIKNEKEDHSSKSLS